MIFRKFLSDQYVLKMGQEPVENVLVEWHAASQRSAPEYRRAEHSGVHIARNDARHRGDELGRVLIIGMQHDDDVGSELERLVVAGLLIGAIPAILRVADDMSYPEFACDFACAIVACIIYENHLINDVEGDLGVRPTKSRLGVVRG